MKSDSSNCSQGSGGSGLALRNRGKGKLPEYRKDNLVNSLTGVQTDSLVSGQMKSTSTPVRSTGKGSALNPRNFKGKGYVKGEIAIGLNQPSGNNQMLVVEDGTNQVDSTKGTSETSPLSQSPTTTCLQAVSPARVFPLPENVKVSRTLQGELFSGRYVECYEVKDQNTYSLRMLKDYFLTIKDAPSQLYSFRWMNLGTMSNGRCVTQSISCPRAGKGSLSSVLEETVEEKYYLNKDTVEKLHEYHERQKEAGRGFSFSPRKKEDIMSALKDGGGGCDDCVIE